MNTIISSVKYLYLYAQVQLFDDNDYILERLIADGDPKSIMQFLERNVNAFARSCALRPECYDKVLTWSVRHGHIEIVNVLLERGIKITHRNEDTLLHSVRNNQIEMVATLSKSSTQSLLDYALEVAVDMNNLKIVTVLLEQGANACAYKDHTLFMSVHRGYNEIVAALLEYGASVYAGDKMMLKKLSERFDERMADAILPYCNAKDYKYFPSYYIKDKIIPTKGAN